MANKKTKKKSQSDDVQAAPSKKPEAKKAAAKKSAPAKKNAKAKKKDKNKKPGFFARIKNYFGSVRSEMKRVVWPTKKELINYSVTVCLSLIVVGLVIAVLDMGIEQALVLFSGLRG
jgi:preprotein translocase subunit SecE